MEKFPVFSSKEEEKEYLESISVSASKAMSLFRAGYNCSQSVFCAFADDLNLDKDIAAKIASSFGGGMGRMREVCGAVSGMFLVAGYLLGYSDPKATTEKTEHYARIQFLANEFKILNNSIVCKDLLGLNEKKFDNPQPEARTESYYKKRPCEILVGHGAFIIESLLKKNNS